MKLARINTLLLVAIIIINGYIIVLPVLPGMFFEVAAKDNIKRSMLEAKVHAGAQLQAISDQNRLVIPSLLFDQQIHEGQDAAALRNGLWRRPLTSTPAQGGNTVIVGHRMTYSNPRGTLYHLNKVQVGDSIGITWEGKNFAYTVREVKVVTSAATEIEEPTEKAQLTIYTCTPLWLPRDRLVVIATPEKDQ